MINTRAKNIIIPKNQESMMMLYENRELNSAELIVFSIPVQDLQLLFKCGFFDEINKEVKALIDDYEEEEIIDKGKIIQLKKVVEDFYSESPIVKYYMNNFVELANYALKFNTGIFFYF